MSSRTLAAAKARRAGENAPPISGSMPRTSIGSHAAFVPPGYQTQLPAPNSNIRVAKSNMPPQPPQQNRRQTSAYQQQQPPQQLQQQPQQPSNGLPFTKLSVSDAIGLITLRLGRVEQWLIENDHEEKEEDSKEIHTTQKIMDQSVLSGLLERLENIEKKSAEESVPSSSSSLSSLEIQELKEEVQKIAETIALMQKEGNRQSVLISKQAEKNLKMERDVVETKDLLKTFMIKYDLFAGEVNDRFADYEQAIADLEKNIMTTTPMEDLLPPIVEEEEEQGKLEEQEENIQVLMSEEVDLKTLVESALG
jgi:hypothetical protein